MLNLQPISYRNGLYQGPFSVGTHSRSGFGLVFTTDYHLTMGSTWHENEANQATFIYYNHAHFVYGFWKMSMPHGFNAVKMGHAFIYAWFDQGVIDGKFLVIYEQYNLAVVLEKRIGDAEGEFTEIAKGDLYSDQELNKFIQKCQWPQFQESWKTLIKFMSAHLVHEQGSNSKPRTKLQLLNHSYYRYGFDEGLAIIFDDEYNIISAGLHRKANLKSLGIKFTKQHFVEEGNFGNQNQVYAFNYESRPDNKIGKLYNNHLLKSVEFVNEFISNPAKILIKYVQFIVNSNLLRKLLAGQITSRKIEGTYASPQLSDRSKKNQSSGRKDKNQTPRLDEYKEIKREEEKKRLRQQKMRLEIYKRELYETINRKSDVKQMIDIENPQEQFISPDRRERQTVVNKPPVEIATRVSNRLRTDAHKEKSRSPIFTPEHFESRSRSISPSRVSPFKERMRSKIFREDSRYDVNNVRASQRKKYFYQTIQQDLYPKHWQEHYPKNYNSPHQELNFSRSRGFDNDQVVPLSMRKQAQPQDQGRRKNQNSENTVRDIKKQIKDDKVSEKQDQEKKNIKYFKRSENPMSFRDQNSDPQPRRQQSDLGTPNIVINSPYEKKASQRKINRAQTQIENESKQKNYNAEGLNRKNNVYLREANVAMEQSPNKKTKKQIKGNTYLQKYNKSKNTPEKAQMQRVGGELKTYNKTIKTFNESNRVYEIVQSPKREDIRSSKVEIPQEGTRHRQITETTPVKKKYQYVFN